MYEDDRDLQTEQNRNNNQKERETKTEISVDSVVAVVYFNRTPSRESQDSNLKALVSRNGAGFTPRPVWSRWPQQGTGTVHSGQGFQGLCLEVSPAAHRATAVQQRPSPRLTQGHGRTHVSSPKIPFLPMTFSTRGKTKKTNFQM